MSQIAATQEDTLRRQSVKKTSDRQNQTGEVITMQKAKDNPEPSKRQIDWEAIQREYRAGILSVREIGLMYGLSHVAILKRAKKFPGQWQRDLSARVQAEVTRKLVTDAVTSEGNEDSIVEEAASRALSIIRKHRTCITRTAEIEAEIFEALKEQAKKPKDKDEKQPAVSTRATTLLALVTAQERRIKLERQAFGISDGARPDDPLTEIPIVFVGTGGGV